MNSLSREHLTLCLVHKQCIIKIQAQLRDNHYEQSLIIYYDEDDF